MGPKTERSASTVRKVEQVITAELKMWTSNFLEARSDEQNPAAAATRMAASPSHSNMVRKMNVSETVNSPLMRGI